MFSRLIELHDDEPLPNSSSVSMVYPLTFFFRRCRREFAWGGESNVVEGGSVLASLLVETPAEHAYIEVAKGRQPVTNKSLRRQSVVQIREWLMELEKIE